MLASEGLHVRIVAGLAGKKRAQSPHPEPSIGNPGTRLSESAADRFPRFADLSDHLIDVEPAVVQLVEVGSEPVELPFGESPELLVQLFTPISHDDAVSGDNPLPDDTA